MALGDLEHSLEYSDKTLSIDSTNATALNAFGSYYMYVGDYEKAKNIFKEALKFHPHNLKIKQNLDSATYYLKNKSK